MRYESVLAAIGNTPLVRLSVEAAPDVAVYAKLELANPFAMKDRVARQMVLRARATGELAEGAPIIESSSGTMALGLALVGTALGHPVHIVTDPRIDPITLTKLEVLGCQVHVVEAMTGAGWQRARLERLARLMSDLDGAFWPRQYSNPDNPAAYRSLADELRADLTDRRLDVLVGAVGSGGSLCGTARVAREAWPDLVVVGVDCTGSVLFAQPDRPQRLPERPRQQSAAGEHRLRRRRRGALALRPTRRSRRPDAWPPSRRSSPETRPARCTGCCATSPSRPPPAPRSSASCPTGATGTSTPSTARSRAHRSPRRRPRPGTARP